MSAFTELSNIDRIAAMKDPVRRNFQITQSYHELSLALAKRTGPCANWCTFATWASRQAGQTIRKEDLAKALENNLAAAAAVGQAIYDIAKIALEKGAGMDKQGIAKLVWQTADPLAAMYRAGAAVARGNRKVYAEIAPEFARFLDACGHDSAYDAEKIARFCSALKPGDPPDGQRYLAQAFNSYYQAFFEPNKKKKAEHILLANIEIGFHEQTRLQPEIAEAMEASVLDPGLFKGNLLKTLFPNQTWWLSVGSIFRKYLHMPTPLDIATGKFASEARRRMRLFLSARMMELGFPKGVRLHLGKDLKANFPADLKTLTNPGLLALLKKIDPTPNSLADTGAVDWASLYDRLHFIADMFRCYQETADLLLPPFDPANTPLTAGE
ncbi:MAG: hypothetical protein IPM81_19550 [Saprospirales bacterium]|nr:hypothetical protein [Saprospirales bacterium]